MGVSDKVRWGRRAFQAEVQRKVMVWEKQKFQVASHKLGSNEVEGMGQ